MRFSRKTLANLARVMEIGHTELNTLFFEHGIEDAQVTGSQRDKALAFLKAVEARKVPSEADEIVLEVTERLLSLRSEYVRQHDAAIQRLLASLNLDGLDYRDGHLVPTTPEPAALGPQITALEIDLAKVELTTAGEHYRQASDNFVDGNWEACNGQLRSFLEDLLIVACERLSGGVFKDPSSALQHLRNCGYLDLDEWNMLRSFWSGIQDNGPHRGLSHDQESLFRLHVSTAVAHFILHKLRGASA